MNNESLNIWDVSLMDKFRGAVKTPRIPKTMGGLDSIILHEDPKVDIAIREFFGLEVVSDGFNGWLNTYGTVDNHVDNNGFTLLFNHDNPVILIVESQPYLVGESEIIIFDDHDVHSLVLTQPGKRNRLYVAEIGKGWRKKFRKDGYIYRMK